MIGRMAGGNERPMSALRRGSVALVVAAAVLSIAGAVFHNVMEFGWATVAGPET